MAMLRIFVRRLDTTGFARTMLKCFAHGIDTVGSEVSQRLVVSYPVLLSSRALLADCYHLNG